MSTIHLAVLMLVGMAAVCGLIWQIVEAAEKTWRDDQDECAAPEGWDAANRIEELK